MLDNAPYHHTYVDTAVMNKKQALAKMQEIGMTVITVTRATGTAEAPLQVTTNFPLTPWFDGVRIPNQPKGPSTA